MPVCRLLRQPRLGAIVSATDIAAAAAGVESLGGTFVMVEADDADSGETEGGYAKVWALIIKSASRRHRTYCQARYCHLHGAYSMTPELMQKMLEGMKSGAVLVDLAVEQGGNCRSKAGKVTTHKGVKLVAHHNVPGRLAGNASELFSRNMFNFLDAFFDKKKNWPDWEDEIITGIGLTRDGKIVHPVLQPKKPAKNQGRKNLPKNRWRKPAKKAAVKKPLAKKAAKKPVRERKNECRCHYLSVKHFRHGRICRLLCGLVGDAGFAHTTYVSHQCYFIGDYCRPAIGADVALMTKPVRSRWLGFGAVILASINIFGGFLVTQRMLAMYRKKD